MSGGMITSDVSGKADTVLTTKGDIATWDTARVRKGVSATNYTGLQADSAIADGLTYGATSRSTLDVTGKMLYASAANTLAAITAGAEDTVLTMGASSVPAWTASSASGQFVKVTKSYSDIVTGTLSMAIYTLPQDEALVNVFTDITTVFDVSTAVTIGDSGDDNGFQEATDWTSGTGLTDATRGSYVTTFKTMRSTSGTTAISAYNFNTGGSSMGSAADGTISGANFETTSPPIGDGWLSFNGSTDYCAANGAATAMSTTGSISVWFKFNALTGENDTKIFSFGDNDAVTSLHAALNSSGKLEIKTYVGGGAAQWNGETDTSSIAAGTWYHLVMTHDGTSPTFWLGALGSAITNQTNMTVVTDEAVWINAGIDNFDIGRDNTNGSVDPNSYLNGGVASLALWNVVLTEAQINVLHDNNDSTPQPATTYPTGLRVYFPFDVDGVMTNAAPVTYDTQGVADFYLQIAKE